MQRSDFEGIFEVMHDLPVTIRLLDPPLHEFLPHGKDAQEEMAHQMGVSVETITRKMEALEEINPMLGHRGCRLGITYPEITEMQTRAIIEAALNVKERGIEVMPEIMVPLIGRLREFAHEEHIIREIAERIFAERGDRIDYKVGTMIEIPRAALTADHIATRAEFFSFGTNDLTQMTFGFSRDDIGKFLPIYLQEGIIDYDPFKRIDENGVGRLIRFAYKKGRKVRPDLKLGICGEHGGDPDSIDFCERVGLHYVSCSPYRVPVARLAAAQAAIRRQREREKRVKD
ncbi:MAG: putative PEP-binding protein, partial [Saprospiraceae bacterium]|nr:putative PEP-binding protein [Saprospiraceae bacterium]